MHIKETVLRNFARQSWQINKFWQELSLGPAIFMWPHSILYAQSYPVVVREY